MTNKIIINNKSWKKNVKALLNWENDSTFNCTIVQNAETNDGEIIHLGKTLSISKENARFEKM